MDIRKVKKLIEILQATEDIGEIEVREGEESVRITRSVAPGAHAVQQVHLSPSTIAPQQAPVAGPAATVYAEPLSTPTISEAGEVIRSPMVGTFYAASSPDAEPFVREGTSVKQGDTLCIIEAMKTINQISATVSGTVVKILVNNGEPIEFDQPLMVIKP